MTIIYLFIVKIIIINNITIYQYRHQVNNSILFYYFSFGLKGDLYK